MPTVTAPYPPGAASFVGRAALTSLATFALLRLPWTEAFVVLPLTRLQAALAVWLVGTPSAPVEATLACSGADALALCVGAVVAYPAPPRARLAGAVGAILLVTGLNIVRIGTLGLAAASPAWFNALHLYVWPAVLTVAIAGGVLAWTRHVDGRREAAQPHRSRRFVGLAGAGLLLFSAAAPFYLESRAVLALASVVAGGAAALLHLLAVDAHVSANTLWTPRGGFAVTQECVATPLIPVYVAAIGAYAPSARVLLLGLLATVPVFVVVGIVRLLAVALPGSVASSAFMVHTFNQLAVAALAVYLAARWRHGGGAALGPTLLGLCAGSAFVLVPGPVYARLIVAAAGAPLDDPQGALAFLPVFQVGLYVAMGVATAGAAPWRRLLGGLAGLGATQLAGLLAVQAFYLQTGVSAHVRDVRAWAIVGPVVALAIVIHASRSSR